MVRLIYLIICTFELSLLSGIRNLSLYRQIRNYFIKILNFNIVGPNKCFLHDGKFQGY